MDFLVLFLGEMDASHRRGGGLSCVGYVENKVCVKE
jgi:hypothetical protein